MNHALELALDEHEERHIQTIAISRGVSVEDVLSSIVERFLLQTNNVERRSPADNVHHITSKKGPFK